MSGNEKSCWCHGCGFRSIGPRTDGALNMETVSYTHLTLPTNSLV